MDSRPILVIGNPTLDSNRVFGGAVERRLGGTGAIAALALRAFGEGVVMAGRVGPELVEPLLPLREAGVEVVAFPAPAALRFENVYPDRAHPERRLQRARSVPAPLTARDVAELLSRPLKGVVLGPLTPTDLSLDLLEAVRRAGLPAALDLQGFLRHVGPEGEVESRPWPEARRWLEGLDFVHAGDDEAALVLGEPGRDAETARNLARRLGVEAAAVTRGGDGAWIHVPGEEVLEVPAFHPAPVVDPTGCGDVFLAAFFHGWLAGWGAFRAGRFASMAAALNASSRTLRCATAEEVEAELLRASRSA